MKQNKFTKVKDSLLGKLKELTPFFSSLEKDSDVVVPSSTTETQPSGANTYNTSPRVIALIQTKRKLEEMKLNIKTSNPEYSKSLRDKYDEDIKKINLELKRLRQ